MILARLEFGRDGVCFHMRWVDYCFYSRLYVLYYIA